MTPDEFWAKVRAAGPWRVHKHQVRSKRSGVCPLVALTGCYGVSAAARTIDIPEHVAWNIANAADFACDPRRALLLKELGLA